MAKRMILFAVLLILIGAAMPAFGTIQPSYKDITDGGCVLNMSTAACFGYSSPSSMGVYGEPTASQCSAKSSASQRCRDCLQAYDDNGIAKGYMVCAYVAYNAGCSCKYPLTLNCQNVGSCSYIRD